MGRLAPQPTPGLPGGHDGPWAFSQREDPLARGRASCAHDRAAWVCAYGRAWVWECSADPSRGNDAGPAVTSTARTRNGRAHRRARGRVLHDMRDIVPPGMGPAGTGG